MIKAVLFDLDGTLVNSLSDLATSTNYALSKLGYPIHNTEEYKYFVGNGIPKLIERALPQNNISEEIKDKCLLLFLEHYRVHYADASYPYKGIKEILNTFKTNSIKTAVVSNKAQEMTDIIIKKLFNDSFNIIAGKREGYKTKPDPALTNEVIKELNVKVNECIFVGDSGMDAATSVNAGCVGVGVTWGFRTEEELLQNGAKYIINTPNELLKVIEKENGTENH